MKLQVHTPMGEYPIVIRRGALTAVGDLLPLTGRRVCVVSDTGVPESYPATVAAACQSPVRFTFPAGEENKTFATLQQLLTLLLRENFDRGDAIVAVGGGVVTDLAGFAAAIYMRGIDFYNIPTTLLAAVDASVGGKTAVDLEGYKNTVGAFWQPRAVVIDPETLNTLPRRRVSDGLSEVIKMAMTCDKDLFETVEQTELLPPDGQPLPAAMDGIIARALAIKLRVVESDVREKGLRRVLNFGHTLGHAIETCTGLGGLYHGECVALGMIPMCRISDIRVRLCRVLEKNGLPTALPEGLSREALLTAISHDKKAAGKGIVGVVVDQIGSFRFENYSAEELVGLLL